MHLIEFESFYFSKLSISWQNTNFFQEKKKQEKNPVDVLKKNPVVVTG